MIDYIVGVLAIILVPITILGAYFAPTIIAVRQHDRQVGPIMVGQSLPWLDAHRLGRRTRVGS